MNPEVSITISGYNFVWDDDNLRVNVTRTRIHNDGRITGDIKLILGKDKHEEPSFNFNFSSDIRRKQTIKSLNEKYPDWQWLPIIDELCRQVQRLSQEGEPVQELWSSDEMEPPEYILDPILMRGLPTVIFGDKGVAKSTLAQLIYVCITLPWNNNPLGFTTLDGPTKAVILDWELPGNIAQWNLKKMVEAMGLGAIPLYHRHCSLPLADDIEQIGNYIDDYKAEVVIIDSLARAAGGELSRDTENANRFFISLEKLKTTSLIIAQTSKTEERKKTIYGNVMFTYFARSIHELSRSESLEENELHVALFHRWSNLTGLHKPIGLGFKYNGNYTFVESETVDYAQFREKVTGQEMILALLKHGAKTPKEIAEDLEMKEASIRVLLSRLGKGGKIVQVDKKWGLKADVSVA